MEWSRIDLFFPVEIVRFVTTDSAAPSPMTRSDCDASVAAIPCFGINNTTVPLKVHKIEIFFGFDFEICIISLLVMSKY